MSLWSKTFHRDIIKYFNKVALISHLWMLYIFLKSVKHPPLLPIRIMKRREGNKTMLRKSPMGRWEKEGKLIIFANQMLEITEAFWAKAPSYFQYQWYNLCCWTVKQELSTNPKDCETLKYIKPWQKTLISSKRKKGAFYETQKYKNTNFHGDFFKSLNQELKLNLQNSPLYKKISLIPFTFKLCTISLIYL
jgi:hypothetical protein